MLFPFQTSKEYLKNTHRKNNNLSFRIMPWCHVFTHIYLSINDENQCTGAPENHLVVKSRVEKVHLTRKVPYVKVDEGAARDVVLVDLVGALQKERLIRGHLMKHHLRFETFNQRWRICRFNTLSYSLLIKSQTRCKQLESHIIVFILY